MSVLYRLDLIPRFARDVSALIGSHYEVLSRHHDAIEPNHYASFFGAAKHSNKFGSINRLVAYFINKILRQSIQLTLGRHCCFPFSERVPARLRTDNSDFFLSYIRL
jgi:hypothetical protein